MFRNFLLSFLFIATGFYIFRNKMLKKKQTGKIIILNGPSCAGKTTIQKAFQELMLKDNSAWIKLGIDNLFDSPFPEITLENIDFWKQKNDFRFVEHHIDGTDGMPIVPLKIGFEGEKIMYGMNNAILGYLEAGNNVILDYIAYDNKFLLDLLNKIRDFKVILVKVDISLTELEKRETKRKTSPCGHARSVYFTVHNNVHYDLVVNSEKHSAEEIARHIKEFTEKI